MPLKTSDFDNIHRRNAWFVFVYSRKAVITFKYKDENYVEGC